MKRCRILAQSSVAVSSCLMLSLVVLTGCQGVGKSPSAPPIVQTLPTISLQASSTVVTANQPITLTVASTNATAVTITNVTGMVPLNGTVQVSPTTVTSYVATATGPGGTATSNAVIVGPPPTIKLTATPNSVGTGQTTVLSFTASSATSVTIDNNVSPSSFAPPAGALTVDNGSTNPVSVTGNTTFTATATGPGGTATSMAIVTVGGFGALQHIIFMVQENRDFDHYFGQLNNYRKKNNIVGPANPDGTPSDPVDALDQLPASTSTADCDKNHKCNLDDSGVPVPAFHEKSVCIENLSPDWLESHGDFDLRNTPASNTALMDGFVHNAAGDTSAANPLSLDVVGHRAMGFYDDGDIGFYYYMASQFATSDRWFSPVSTNSEVNRIYLHAATSHGLGHAPSAVTGTTCCENFGVKSIFHELDAAGISWKIYYTDIDKTTGRPDTDLWRYWPKFAAAHTPAPPLPATNIVPVSQYFTDVQNNTLPAVAFIQAGLQSGNDEHPGGQVPPPPTNPPTPPPPLAGGNNIQTGEHYVATLMNALVQSPSYASSVFIWSMDEGGGLFDHVPPAPAVNPDGIAPTDMQTNDIQFIPPKGFGAAPPFHCDPPVMFICDPTTPSSNQPGTGFDRTGFRLPLIVISPFVKPHYVSHTVMDFTAILALIEKRFGVSALTLRDQSQLDSKGDPLMNEFFDFQNVPLATPPAIMPAPTPNGTCNPSLEGTP